MKNLVLLVVLISIFLSCISTPARADAGASSPYVVNVGPQLPEQQQNQAFDTIFSNAQDAGLRWGFIFLTWSDVEKVPGTIDFSTLDQIVESAHSHRINLILQVQTTGDWSVTTPAIALATGGYRTNSMVPLLTPKTAAPMNIDAAIPFWQAVVGRYRRHGALAREQHWHDGYGIEDYEVENEPDFLPWVNGNWESVTKDYALFLSHLAPAVKKIDSHAKLLAPALSGVDSGTSGPIQNTGLTWLDTLLSADSSTLTYASDQYRMAGLQTIGAGPSIDIFSFHCDFVDPSTNAHVMRGANVRQIVAKYFAQPNFPTSKSAPAWCTEGSATNYDSSNTSQQFRFAWAQVQYAAEMLGGGVPRFNYDLGVEGGDAPSAWSQAPIRGATLAMTEFFPSPKGVANVSPTLTADAGQTVFGYQWRNPATGARATLMWAQDEPQGSGTTEPPFSFSFPVRGRSVTIIDPHDWSRTRVGATGGAVSITLNRADPSPPYMVIEGAR